MAFRAIRVNPLYFPFVLSARMHFVARDDSREKKQLKMSAEDQFAREPTCFPSGILCPPRPVFTPLPVYLLCL